ncbi:tetratricopeptide repeat-containing sensor histidine kinase [Spirosoma spitsbergense]|uniref:tetratricopeptide repeat-containing sensor histidine kinase n=1 Tax=Spirosoma spitsbergense TaxID=431554 RepID=UPI00037708A2|nr:ATP-binding protein [Spirosoma spitsbergense]
MLSRLLLICFLFCSSLRPAFAQRKTGQARLDSLLAELPRAKPDTNRVNLLYAISSSYSRTSPGSSYSRINPNEDINYANQALELARQLAWKKGMLVAYLGLGITYANKFDYPQAMKAYLSGLKIAEERKDKFGIIAISTITLYMGNIYSSLANYPQALAYYEKSLKGSEESGSKTGVVVGLNNIGSAYSEQGEYGKALDYRLKSLKLNEAMGFQGPPKEMNFDNVGQSYLNLANYPQALTYLQNGLNISKANRNKTILVRSYNNLSKLYLKIATDSNATSLTTLLKCNKTSTLQKASAYADSAIVLAKERSDLPYLYRAYQTRSQIQDALGDPQAALASYQDFIKTKELVINQQNNNNIAVATLQYDFDKKETALQFQQQLTAAQLQKQTLLTKQQAQELSLKVQAAQLAIKERDLQRLEYLQERAAKQDKEKQLALSQKEQALKASALELSQAEVKNQTQQRTYLLGGVGLLAALLGLIAYGYTQKQKANVVLHQQKEEINQKSNQLEQSLAELKATQAQLVQKEKMASLGELTAGIAHEIQNPLNFVNNFSEVSAELVTELKEEREKDRTGVAGERDGVLEDELLEDLQQNLLKINHHGSRASAIVRGMLEHSRSSTGEKRPTNLNALADEYLKIAYHGLRAKDKEFNAELKTDFETDLSLIEVAPQEIGRVLLNLYNNAFYAVQEKQTTAPSGYQPTVTVSTVQLNGQVEIRVSDNGTGISKSVRDKIFQPFFTTKPTGEGTGLGLSLSYDIITKGHGGSLTVESQEGEGTTFVIQLPVLS